MKYNTYQKGQCTYYVFDKVREDHHQIAKSWHDAKDWAKNAKKINIKSINILKKVRFYRQLKENMVM